MAKQRTIQLYLDTFQAYDGISGFIQRLAQYLQSLPEYPDFPKVEYKQVYSPEPYEPGEALSHWKASAYGITAKLETRQYYSPNRDGAHLTSSTETFSFTGYEPLSVSYASRSKLVTLAAEDEELERFLSFYFQQRFADDYEKRADLARADCAPSMAIYRSKRANDQATQTAAAQTLQELLVHLPDDLKLHRAYVDLLFKLRSNRQRYVDAIMAYSAAAPDDEKHNDRRKVEEHLRKHLPSWRAGKSVHTTDSSPEPILTYGPEQYQEPLEFLFEAFLATVKTWEGFTDLPEPEEVAPQPDKWYYSTGPRVEWAGATLWLQQKFKQNQNNRRIKPEAQGVHLLVENLLGLLVGHDRKHQHVSIDGEEAKVRDVLATYYRQLGYHNDIEGQVQLGLYGHDPALLIGEARQLYEKGEGEDALLPLKIGLEALPDHIWLLWYYLEFAGELHYDRAYFVNALEEYAQAIAALPPGIHDSLRHERRLQQYEEALSEW